MKRVYMFYMQPLMRLCGVKPFPRLCSWSTRCSGVGEPSESFPTLGSQLKLMMLERLILHTSRPDSFTAEFDQNIISKDALHSRAFVLAGTASCPSDVAAATAWACTDHVNF